jgi:hypothetical protein
LQLVRSGEKFLWVLFGALWLGGLAIGAKALWDYQSTPGAAANPEERWPASSRLARDPDRATLIMLAHPRCPCTRASLGELAVLMQRLRGRVAAHVIFVRPRGVPEGWEQTDTWRAASGIPGVEVWKDEGGIEAARFAAKTSGQVLLYDRAGRLAFNGGITPIRGHLGDSTGQERIVSLVTTGKADAATSRVFGCALGPL